MCRGTPTHLAHQETEGKNLKLQQKEITKQAKDPRTIHMNKLYALCNRLGTKGSITPVANPNVKCISITP